ncbi:MDR family MFS transporter [Nakamurella deserti]|uniref:MDR family MFS transporter n=1 Tax=Nakamurella deserti TaxID=2164074 RepID=UPI000DBE1ACD|nr:MDR family MFS transporter [Nakamurella deserti]
MTSTTSSDADVRPVGFRSDRGPILIALMLSTSLVALDSTIIATAVPSVVDSLGGFTSFPWLFSIYLLAQAVSVPIYGRFADLYGRKPIIFLGIGLFLLGSILCGFAWSMPALIAFRAVQGLGAGAVQPIAMTIAGDIYTVAERARVQGYLASVWAISAVVGPTLGGVFSEWISWRWIFFVNIPFCLLAGWLLARNLKEKVERTPHVIDVRGALLLTVGCALLILGLLEGGEAWAWNSLPSLVVLIVGPLMLIGFVLVERTAAEPILPLWVLRRRLLAATSATTFLVGAVLLGLTSYVPTYVQTALGTGPLTAGFALATLTLGWPIAASLSGRLYLRIGFRNTALIGSVLVVAGAALTATLGLGSSVWQVGLYCFVVGLGMGLVASPSLIAAQSSVGWTDRGVVTGTNMFARSVGSAVGVALFGAIANASLGGSDNPTAQAMSTAAHQVFLVGAVLTVLMGLAVAFIPKRIDAPA